MKQQEVLDRLKNVVQQFNWTFENNSIVGYSKSDNGVLYCPLTAIYKGETKEYCHRFDWYTAAKAMKVDRPLALRIVRAADKASMYSARLRKRLLEICNLEEP